MLSRVVPRVVRPSFSSLRFLNTGPYENILVEQKNNVALVTLNRPKALNALNDALIDELIAAANSADEDENIGAVVITGSTKAFAAGADIVQMAKLPYMEAYNGNLFSRWRLVSEMTKPLIAAVNGYALGGGCELAMMCDIIIAGDKARFGQPEVKIGTIPGCGGTQRLIRAVGKSKAMEMVLTGDMITAEEARDFGLVTRVVPADDLVDEALKMGDKISALSKPIIAMAKEMVNLSAEVPLAEGVRIERRTFHSTFATDDQKEGMGAFIEKRDPNFTDK